MSLQSFRPSLVRCKHATRALAPCLRTYTTTTTTPTPETFKIPESDSNKSATPRWKETPAGMKAPMQMDFARSPKNKVWAVNNNPAKLDEMYEKLLGPGGSKMLPEELKWLAVTHKSFDQGRRGFNDKLALMGRLTMLMEATKEIVSKGPLEGSIVSDEFGRTPIDNEQLLAVDNLNVEGPKDVIGKEKLHALANKVGLLGVVRWKPRLTHRLESSGVETVLPGAIMAIVGAITLQHGSVIASQIVRDRILAQLDDA